MSIKLMAAIWENGDQELSGTKLNILLCLADHANDAGVCWPTIDRIAERARVHRSNVMRAVRDLEAMGYVEVIREEGRVNRYVVKTSSAGATGTSSAGATPTSSAGATGPVALARPEPSITISREPSIEPSSSRSSSPPHPAPAAAPEVNREIFDELSKFGVGEPVLTQLSQNGHTIDTVRGWTRYLATQQDLRNPPAFLVARLRAHDPPPELDDVDDDSYEALRRKYVPDGWEDVIRY